MQDLLKKAQDIRCLVCDMDGVLTEGFLVYGEQGELFKSFHAHDGFGLQLLMSTGVEVAIITTAKTPIVDARLTALKIKHIYQGQHSKSEAYDDLLNKLQLKPEQMAMVGDDFPDIPLIMRSGLGIAPANALDDVKEIADWVTSKPGGCGAVREICNLIMQAQNTYQDVLKRYLPPL